MTTIDTLLIEIGTEELPPSHLDKLSEAFAEKISEEFASLGITFSQVEHYVTPRRLAARFSDIPSKQPHRTIKRRGPALASAYDKNGQATPALLGFAKSCGTSPDNLKKEETAQGSWLVFETEEKGQTLQDLLGPIIEKALNAVPASKKMRWSDLEISFIRPIHWIVALHGATPLPVQVFGMIASNISYGHRVHAPNALVINHADNYLNLLFEAKVIANHHERMMKIENECLQIAEHHAGQAVISKNLLDQVAGLNEWPCALYGHFDKAFLEVPQEALISAMQQHQKCFPVRNFQGKLLPFFILISNIESPSPEKIIHGNERVMHARLEDAKFFYDQDRKNPLASRVDSLRSMVFQKKLGSLYDKSMRIAKLAGHIAKLIEAKVALAERAGILSKADLLSEMVFEFPELQGIMGYYYALNDNEPPEVALAIKESYLPRFSKDDLPESPLGIALALADRIDTLMGIFGIGQAPTGDKDPFALRRQALAIIRIIIEKHLFLDLEKLCFLAAKSYGTLFDEAVVGQVLEFFMDRFKTLHQEKGINPQVLDSVLSTKPSCKPYDCSRRVFAVDHFQTLPEAQHLASANKRVRNILQKSGQYVLYKTLHDIDPTLLKEDAEIKLYEEILRLKEETKPLIQQGEYQEALVLLATLQKPVDDFFDKVLVMAEDEKLKNNRLSLLGHLSALFLQIADISKLAL